MILDLKTVQHTVHDPGHEYCSTHTLYMILDMKTVQYTVHDPELNCNFSNNFLIQIKDFN